MKPWLIRILFVLSALLAATAPTQAARPSKPMTLFVENPISTASGKTPSRAEIDQAIIRAGKERDWVITSDGDGTLKARLLVRTHTLDVLIRVDGARYDIVYADSKNLGYAPNAEDPSRPLIHPAYNKWVQNLVTDISREFNRM